MPHRGAAIRNLIVVFERVLQTALKLKSRDRGSLWQRSLAVCGCDSKTRCRCLHWRNARIYKPEHIHTQTNSHTYTRRTHSHSSPPSLTLSPRRTLTHTHTRARTQMHIKNTLNKYHLNKHRFYA